MNGIHFCCQESSTDSSLRFVMYSYIYVMAFFRKIAAFLWPELSIFCYDARRRDAKDFDILWNSKFLSCCLVSKYQCDRNDAEIGLKREHDVSQ